MAKQKPTIPKGMRDFSPREMMRREYIFQTIKDVYRKFGFLPIETPAMENLSTLTGKYGEEGDKLLFKVLNTGNFLSKVDIPTLPDISAGELVPQIAEKGLRYDLTVPFARYVVQHQNEIVFPFKRYQVQAVWRADRPQKGRYREFYQCDADVIGTDSLLSEAEFIRIIDLVFSELGLKVTLKLNNRKILAGIAEYIGDLEKLTDITVSIDKLDKIGEEKVRQELKERGLAEKAVDKLFPVLALEGSAPEKLETLSKYLSETEYGKKGVEEVQTILEYIVDVPMNNDIDFDISLARGLDYYTGAIFEVKANDAEIGSICGGGRYDNLTGIFGLPGVSGVGISFGADRIYDALEQLDLFPGETDKPTAVMFVNFGIKEVRHCISLAEKLRKEDIPAEVYPDPAKMKKQMSYADKNKISFVALVGENEINNRTVTLKNMQSGEQQEVSHSLLAETIKKEKNR